MDDRSPAEGSATFREMAEFATFPASTQRYIRRSLDVAQARSDILTRWSRDVIEAASIRAQLRIYELLGDVRANVPETPDYNALLAFQGPLAALTGFDIGQGRLGGFSAYRFLYERLIGARVRPWLPGAFASAAMLPSLEPARRRALLETIPEAVATAPGWSTREPVFFPEWIDKSDLAEAA
jgi:hypothetical protein